MGNLSTVMTALVKHVLLWLPTMAGRHRDPPGRLVMGYLVLLTLYWVKIQHYQVICHHGLKCITYNTNKKDVAAIVQYKTIQVHITYKVGSEDKMCRFGVKTWSEQCYWRVWRKYY